MNANEPDKFEQFMSWVHESGTAAGGNVQWLYANSAGVAIMLVAALVVLALLGVAADYLRGVFAARQLRFESKIAGMRHVRRRR